ncbi:Ribosomal RNA small subunit methyltransferase B [Fundidesulfovibrio magnetotacticus]|uniref:Ribosomal RNA small subunit methyltransferase B n=1 Tax=Fundidesulfovibrio magnetotacticus TaxID=2730080 RepID=A0A6V8LXP1_9BACT|nr:transcription antitermination factor NusB [Fundidesulfovibrio magnetotacticus]GFK95351.1 Ribosomal RNA small subunit methyltransferase B [Fundidesulfovibrio magnetotacticus]
MGGPRSLPPARAAALAALDDTLPLDQRAALDVQAALDRALRPLEDPRDRGLATELVYGWLRLKGRMDHLVRRQLSRPDGTPPMALRLLSLGAYELVHLDQVPPHATLSWTVDAVRARCGEGPARLANAVLRRIQALGRDASNPEFYRHGAQNRLEFLSVWHSMPAWIVKIWLDQYPDTAQHLLESQTASPLAGFRLNRARPDAQTLFNELTRSAPARAAFPWIAFEPHSVPPGLEDACRDGLASRQSFAAGDMLQRLGFERWPGPVWDACAGRGGKSLALAESGVRPLWASDVSAPRLRGHRQDAWRLGLECPALFFADATRPPLKASPAVILVDAPCTGLGVLSRRPDAKWKRTFADIGRMVALQRRIVGNAARLLKPGGLLAYITCTLTLQENEQQAAHLESLGFRRRDKSGTAFDAGLREFFWGGAWEKS